MEINKKYGVAYRNEIDTLCTPMVHMSIEYYKGGKGYLSYYYLSVYSFTREKRDDSSYVANCITLKYGCKSDVMLTVVPRKSAKEQSRLDAWLEANQDGIMNAAMFGVVGKDSLNMKAVFNYVCAHRPGGDVVGQYQSESRYYSRALSEAYDGYQPCTEVFMQMSTMVHNADYGAAYVDMWLNDTDTTGNIKGLTELYLCCAWNAEYADSKHDYDRRGAYAAMAQKVYDYIMVQYPSNSDEVQYFMEMID